MPNILIPLLFLLAGPAQAAQNPVVSTANQCTVQGVVLKAGTDEPLGRATVEIWLEGGVGQLQDTASDSMGRFEVKNLDPGRYRLSVQHNGYVRQEYGQTKPGGSGSYLTLSPGQKVSDITIQLIPAAVITGHVYDENGDPVQGAQVSALRPVYGNGQRELAHSGEARTNDLGEYRVYGLAPGQYIVEAEKQPRFVSVLKAQPGYVPIYYPGVSDPGRAAPIAVQAGEEFSSADITLQTTQTVKLRGHVISGMSGGPALHAQIYLVSQGTTSHVTSRSFVNDPRGAFELRDAAPGTYFLYAFLYEGGRGELARQPIEVAEADLDGITLTVAPGVDIKGRLRIEGSLGSSVGSFQVSLSPKSIKLFFGGMPSDIVKPNGNFLLKNAFDDVYEIFVEGLPANYFLKSARLDGIDGLTAGVTIDSKQTPGLLDIVVSPNGARIDGMVSRDQQPFQGASVTLVPDPPHRGEQRLFKAATTDQLGHFVLQGIPPGDYKVFAWESIDPGAYRSSDFLQPFESRGESIHISEGSLQSVQLELIPGKESGR
ncbi:MAG: collagen binding domain-containing protein [Terriglobia bacterium]